MRRGGGLVLLTGLAIAGLAAGIVVPGSGANAKGSDATSRSKVTTLVTVTVTDSRFTLSKRSASVGTVIFSVTNKGKISHNFKIAGKTTPLLAPGHSATLRVTFSKKGRYPYLSTVPGQASAGMKGVFSVVSAATPKPMPTPTTAPPTTTTGTVGTATTTVNVQLLDQDSSPNGTPTIVLSQLTMPSGMITFVITSKCGGGCTFHIDGIKAGAVLSMGQSETWTVALAPGRYNYHSDVSPIITKGSFTVTS